MKHFAAIALLLAGLAMACSEGEVNPNTACSAGDTQECPCQGGGFGTQTCTADGAWGACTGCDAADVIDDTDPMPEDVAQEVEDTTPPEETTDPEEVTQPKICLLNNCQSDEHCTGCTEERQTCLLDENRCVACIPGTTDGCAEGMECSSFGICVPQLLTCPTDENGDPTVVCIKNADCKACSPMHQVCDTTTGKCQACTGTNTAHCLANDICKDGKCAPKCPQSCNLDNDCMYCGSAEKPLHACNNHKCSECSPTWPCPADMVCLANGVCYPPCGLPGPVSGTCITDDDCHWCGDPKNPGAYECRKPVNDPDGHGTCAPPAEGCEDLGKGIAVLPEPWSQYTQLCSNDDNCAGIAITLNIGQLLRDALGMDEIPLGGSTSIAIGDANVSYGMHECAEVSLTDDIDCGVCVPCDEDADCDPIPIDPLMLELFSEDPLAAIAGTLLVDMLWGENDDHNLNFYCQPVGLGYGVCAPCGNPTQACGKTVPDGSGNCDHEVCTPGTALDPSCGPCATQVCTNDAYCCETEWDDVCVGEVDLYCTTPCGGTSGCADDICTNDALPAQAPGCGDCVASVCAEDPFCCNKESGAWDEYCVAAAQVDAACTPLCGGSGGCAHDECAVGGPLNEDCSDCAAAICAADDFCCIYEWDSQCVEEALMDDACSCN